MAAEPMLANPVSFTIQDDGSFFVAETFRHTNGVTDIRSHMDWCDDDLASRTVADRLALLKKHLRDEFQSYSLASEQIRKIWDADQDGTADHSTVFAAEFNEPTAGIGAGVLAFEGNIYYTCIPKLWKLRDTNNDGVADERAVMHDGYGVHITMLGHDLHGLQMGPDGLLYFSCGDRGLNVETGGRRVECPEAGAVLRCRPDGSDLEIFSRGLRNPQELAFDEFGNLFTGDNNSDGGDRARWVHVVEGADHGWRYGYQWMEDPYLRGSWNAEKLWHPHFPGQAAYIVPPICWLGSGPSGLAYDPGTGLGPEFRKHFFLVEFEGDSRWSGIFTFKTTRKGASFETSPVEKFVWNMLPTDCEIGPDGNFYFIDWVQGWNTQGKGRIYRVSHTSNARDPLAAEVAVRLREGFRNLQNTDLAALLEHPDVRLRRGAQFELVKRGAPSAQIFESTLKSKNTLARIHGIWGLLMLARDHHAVDPGIFIPLLGDPDVEVREKAARACGDLAVAAAKSPLIKLLKDPAPQVRAAACIAVSKIKIPEAESELVALLEATGEKDPVLRHCIISGLAGCAPSDAIRKLKDHPSVDVRVGAVVALRRLQSAVVQDFIQDKDPRVAAEAARAIYDVPIAAAMPALAALCTSKITDNPAVARRALAAAFRLGGADFARAVASIAGGPLAAPLRTEAVQHLSHWVAPSSRDVICGEWRPIVRAETPEVMSTYLISVAGEISASMDTAPPEVRSAWLEFIATYKLVAELPRVGAWLESRSVPASLRGEAMKTFISLKPADLEERLKIALRDPAVEVRVAALDAILDVTPGATLDATVSAMKSGSPKELRAAYKILANFTDPKAEELLRNELAKLDAGWISPEVRLDLASAGETRFKETLAGMLPARTAAAQLDPALAPFVDTLHGGDASHGGSIFRNNSSLSCLRCHKTSDDDAGVVGPDLRNLAKRATRLQILESIVEPDRKITNGYDSIVFELNDNQVIAGRVESEDATTIKIRKADNTVEEMPLAKIRERRPDVSAMPGGLAAFIKPSEMRDLIEFLATLD